MQLTTTTDDYPTCRFCTYLILGWCAHYKAKIPSDFVNKKNNGCAAFGDGLDEQ